MAVTVLTGMAEAFAAPESVWSLQRAGMDVTLLARRGRGSAARHLRHVRVVEICPPEESVSSSLRDIGQVLRAQEVDAFLPLDDASLWLADRVEWGGAVLAGPTGEALTWALDKSRQIDTARRAGVTVPDTEVFPDPQRVTGSAWPVVVKPAWPIAQHEDTLIRPPGAVCANAEELAAAIPRLARMPVLVQPLLRGVGTGVFGVCDAHGAEATSAHRRVRMVNPQGSASSACESTPVDEAVAAPVARMLAAVAWRGQYMAEFLQDADGTSWFMEVNGRAWGSMALARRRGYEYPAWTVQTALGLPLDPDPPEAAPAVRCRHLGREIMHAAFVARGPQSAALDSWPARGATLRDLLTFHRGDRWYNWNPAQPSVLAWDTWTTLTENVGALRARRRSGSER